MHRHCRDRDLDLDRKLAVRLAVANKPISTSSVSAQWIQYLAHNEFGQASLHDLLTDSVDHFSRSTILSHSCVFSRWD